MWLLNVYIYDSYFIIHIICIIQLFNIYNNKVRTWYIYVILTKNNLSLILFLMNLTPSIQFEIQVSTPHHKSYLGTRLYNSMYSLSYYLVWRPKEGRMNFIIFFKDKHFQKVIKYFLNFVSRLKCSCWAKYTQNIFRHFYYNVVLLSSVLLNGFFLSHTCDIIITEICVQTAYKTSSLIQM